MNEPSAFQVQYPLSSRKFWKKIIQKTFVVFLLGFLVGIFAILIPVLSGGPDSSSLVTLIIAFLLGVIVFFGVVMGLYAWYVKAYIKRYYYDCGEQFVTIKKGVFAPTEIHVQYQKIQDVYVDQDILDRIMGLYDVHIASATVTSGIEAHIDGVDFTVAEALKNIILGKINNTGHPTNSTPQAIQQTANPQPQVSKVQFNQKISSDTYPMSGKWIISAVFNAFFHGVVLTLFLTISIFSKMENGVDLNLALFILPALIFGFAFLISIIYNSLWKINFYFEFMPDYILLRTGIISKSENHLPYKAIQNVLNSQGIVDRILGLSTVTIQNAAQQYIPSGRGQVAMPGSGIVLPWQPKDRADEINKVLNDITSKINPQSSASMGV